jgi:hypothetical protein
MSDVLNKASLILIPSGYKSGKLYSQIPENGNGDLSFTRASTATRVNSAGLIEKVRTNLILQSETFDNASWTKEGCSVTANSTTDPFGTSNADVVVENALPSTQHRLLQIPTISNATEHSTSLYVKRIVGTRDFAIINIVSGARVYFDLTTGTVGTEVLGKGSIQNVGNGWYRCTATGVSTGTSASVYLALTNATTAGSETYSGDGVSSLAFYGAQFETGVTTDYIPTTTAAVSVGMTANVPRLDYLGSSCPSLLLEPQRTNLFRFSEQFDQSFWTKSNTTVTPNTTISPDGYQNADTMTTTASTSRIIDNSVYGAGTYTGSLYLKRLTGNDNFQFRFVVDSSNQIQNFNATSEWQRFTFTVTAASELRDLQFRSSGAGTGTFAIWGAQLEVGAYPTSYIPTLGTSVTRVADAASKTGISSLIGQTEGTVFLEIQRTGNSLADRLIFGITDGTSNNRIRVLTTSDTRLRFLCQLNGNVIQYDFTTSSLSFGQTDKIAFAYKSGDIAVYINGNQVNTSTNSLTISSTLIYLDLDGAAQGTSHNQALLFKTRLSNTELAQLTTL